MGSTAVASTDAANEAVLEVSRLSCSYDRALIVEDVSFDVRRGEIFALIGPSGSGKTTLLRALNRLHDLTPNVRVEGSVLLHGIATEDAAFSREELRRRVGYVFQLPNPFPMSVYDNIALPLREHRLVADEGDCRRRVRDLLERVGLLAEVGERLDESALELSGGQQQRLCIARLLAAEPDVILLDEPCSALDPQATAVIERLLAAVKTELALVVVTHNLAQARRIADGSRFCWTESSWNSARAIRFSNRRATRARVTTSKGDSAEPTSCGRGDGRRSPPHTTSGPFARSSTRPAPGAPCRAGPRRVHAARTARRTLPAGGAGAASRSTPRTLPRAARRSDARRATGRGATCRSPPHRQALWEHPGPTSSPRGSAIWIFGRARRAPGACGARSAASPRVEPSPPLAEPLSRQRAHEQPPGIPDARRGEVRGDGAPDLVLQRANRIPFSG